MENKILAHLGSRLTNQRELLATEGLTYLLQRSDLCRRGIEQLASTIGCELSEIVSYESEISGENLERPDVVGRTGAGVESLIIEGKFDAGLTENQPKYYFARLPVDGPGLLIFVVPSLRIFGLWRVVVGRVAIGYKVANERELPDGSRSIEVGPRHRLLMISWSNLLNCFLQPAQRASAPISGDVLQLIELCSRIEGQIFKPFSSAELTSTSTAIRNRDLCNIVDAITDKLVADGLVSVAGLKATPQKDGYVRYIKIGGAWVTGGAGIRLDYSAWIEHQQSPLWLVSGGESVALLRPIFKQVASEKALPLVDSRSSVMLPLDIMPGQEFAEIVGNAVKRVTKVARLVAEQVSEKNS
jgi:hypothetical protein